MERDSNIFYSFFFWLKQFLIGIFGSVLPLGKFSFDSSFTLFCLGMFFLKTSFNNSDIYP